MSSRPGSQLPGKRRTRGFQPAARLVQERIRTAGEARGFALSRLLTHWDEIVGSEIARMARPVKMGYGRDGFGATLVLLTTGAAAPLVQMQIPAIRDKVNACYGYNAVSRVALTQTAATGFAEAQAAFAPAARPGPENADQPDNTVLAAEVAEAAEGVQDAALRAALEALARNILSRDRRKKDFADG
ncbi:DUF721 domain-containing protein [Alkalilacustris brevis]|uniref:DUF721 domain-containing protein n=1 Tax=Alkalilacustris brevis TaxID=2026338 RepID=UPI001EE4155B|nr:DUF721 domain-containing protein [Alkalilacustris brevis]